MKLGRNSVKFRKGCSMTTVFLLVCCFGVGFFLIFLWKSGEPRRPVMPTARTVSSHEMLSVNAAFGRRTFARIERQMADFMDSHKNWIGVEK